VKIPSESEVRELYELREALESQTARLFAERSTPAERRALRRLGQQLDGQFARLTSNGDDPAVRFAVHREHVQFHMRIAENAGSQLLKQMIERKHVLILNWMFDVTGRRTALPDGFHSALAEALTSGNPERADATMRTHVRYGLAEIAGRIGALAASEWRERRTKTGSVAST
jgi:GntR family transcriptional regulator, rspAB operon transcriptional repressor